MIDTDVECRPSASRQMESWTNMAFHRAFIEDDVRNQAYQAAMARQIGPGSTVVDIGCGTGLLSFLARKSGAGRVLGVDWSSIIPAARETARRNGFGEVVEFIKADARTIGIGDHPFLDGPPDVIVHELLGGLVWDEDYAEVLTAVREKVAGPDTVFLPSMVRIHLVPISSPARVDDQEFWTERHYGLDMSAFLDKFDEREFTLKRTAIHLGNSRCFLAEPQLQSEHLFGKRDPESPPQELTFHAAADGFHDGYLGFMEIGFGDADVSISTHPDGAPTNWGQFILPTPAPRSVSRGDEIRVRFTPARWSADWAVETSYPLGTTVA